MGFEPEKFFIGLVDFFTILMPGALVTYLLKDDAAFLFYGHAGYPLDGAEAWMVFFFASYLLGHFAFLLGASLDQWIYDPLRGCTYWGQVRRLADGKGLSGRLPRSAASNLFGTNADAAVMQTQRIKARALQPLSAEKTMNAFQWCKSRLSKEHPEGFLAVERFEAASKFFRSFFIVLVALTPFLAIQQLLIPTILSLIFLILALLRYMDQRFKSTQQAYWFILMLESTKVAATPTEPARNKTSGLTHAGGIVFRERDNVVEYLLVQASKNRAIWVLPKGHIEPGEDPRETAVREVKEETGCWARVLQWVDDLSLLSEGNVSVARFYLMHAVDGPDAEKRSSWPEENRKHEWLVLEQARQRATFEETKRLLVTAEAARQQRMKPQKIDQPYDQPSN